MGYRDYKLILCSSQTVTEEVSDYYIDTELTNPGWEKGRPLEVVINVETAATGGTGYVFALVHNASGAPTLGDITVATVSVLNAELSKGKEIKLRFPDGVEILRYVGINIGDITSGESMVISAYIQPVG